MQVGREKEHCLGCKGGSVHHTCGKAPDADYYLGEPPDELFDMTGTVARKPRKEPLMKKKVIAITIDTDLTNEQIEESHVELLCRDKKGEDENMIHEARNVRVLDSD